MGENNYIYKAAVLSWSRQLQMFAAGDTRISAFIFNVAAVKCVNIIINISYII
jgi:hypothetical protein